MHQNYVGNCSICGQGSLVVVKETGTRNYLVICDDCESQWKTPEMAINCDDVITDEIENVEDASLEEITEIGWDVYLVKYD